ncbi:MAG TPA: hypothetical protein VIM10_09985 [Actinopolymorphaceae bacterium]
MGLEIADDVLASAGGRADGGRVEPEVREGPPANGPNEVPISIAKSLSSRAHAYRIEVASVWWLSRRGPQ